jgi:flagellar biosynthetic protein FlhB
VASGEERTEKATPQRRKKVRQEGRLSRSPELGAWLGMLGASVLLPVSLRAASTRVEALLVQIPAIIEAPEPGKTLHLVREGASAAAFAVAPLCFGLMLIGIVSALAQGGLHPSVKLLMPKPSRINPFSGLKRAVGPHAWWELVKALVKTTVLTIVLYSSIRKLVPVLVASGSLPVAAVLATVGNTLLTLLRSAALAGVAMAAFDVLVVMRRNNKQSRMTKQEVKEEHRRSEGDPQLKGAIRSRQLMMSRNRMMAELPKADVVVVNPTHVAVALRYEASKGAPRVVAKGAGVIAARIREKATEHRIPMVQDAALARTLYAACDLGSEIPPDLYTAVARVLAFVMNLKARGSAAGLHHPQLTGNPLGSGG